MGGTFDPPHLGHVVPVEAAVAEFNLDRVDFVPAFIPPHKSRPGLTDSHHRAAMVAIALQPYRRFLLSPEELATRKVRFTVETLTERKAKFRPEDRLFFIMGSDSFLEIETWRDYQRLIRLCEFIIIDRGDDQEVLKSKLNELEKALQLKSGEIIHFARAPHLPISSTEIRKALQEGKSVSDWLSPGVEQYITKHFLYHRR
jgi:nicotinate-nucleotide adenylyltransferase